MIFVALGRWNHSAGRWFISERIWWKSYLWTPFIRVQRRYRLGSITDVRCRCTCGWNGTVGDCEPDVDEDGSPGCPVCLLVVDCDDAPPRPAERVGINVPNPQADLNVVGIVGRVVPTGLMQDFGDIWPDGKLEDSFVEHLLQFEGQQVEVTVRVLR